MNLKHVYNFLFPARHVAGLLFSVVPAWATFANINLELRPALQGTNLNCNVSLGLYAVSDSANNQSMSAIQVIISWDIAKIQLQGFDNTGGQTWLASGFLANPYHLNDSTSDGDAMWIGLAPLGARNAIQATPAGTLLTTFRFHPLAGTNPTTLVNIEHERGNPPGHTIVYDGTTPNTDITGTLTGAAVEISTCPGDTTFNHFVNVDDLLLVINHWGTCPNGQLCCPGDVTGNGAVNVDDLLAVINGWGACP